MANVVVSTFIHQDDDGIQGAELLMDDVTLDLVGVRVRNTRPTGRQATAVVTRIDGGAQVTIADMTNNREEDITGRAWKAERVRGEIRPGVSLGLTY